MSPMGAPLIPKLRGHFAEFLLDGYLERLRILSSSTCVGLRYGHLHNSQNEAFLGGMGSSSWFGMKPHFPIPLGVVNKSPDLPKLSTYRSRSPISVGA